MTGPRVFGAGWCALVLLAGCGGGTTSPSGTAVEDSVGAGAPSAESSNSGAQLHPTVAAFPLDVEGAVETQGLDALREQYVAAWNAVATSADFERVYEIAGRMDGPLTLQIGERLGKAYQAGDDPFYEMKAWLESDLGVPGLTPSCEAECTVPVAARVREDFADLARRTPGTDDDAFVDLAFDYWLGGGWAAVFERTWDYGGYSRLGDGAYLDFLRRIQPFSSGVPGLVDEVARIREHLFEQIGIRCIGSPADDALMELETIEGEITLSGEEQVVFDDLQAAIERVDPSVEVSCAEASCECSSG